MVHMNDGDKAELREKTRVVTEEEEHAAYEIPKDQVSEYFTYGKPQEEMARILGKILAREHWGLTEEEAYENDVSVSKARDVHGAFKLVVYQGSDVPEDESSLVDE